MFLVNSRPGHFSAALKCSPREADHTRGRSFSRSYGAIMLSSFTRFHSSALVYSTRPPVSVSGTGSSGLTRGFSWKHFISLRAQGAPLLSICYVVDFLATHIRSTTHTSNRGRTIDTSSPHHVFIVQRWCRNINLLSIAYAFRPQLRSRLTLGGLTCPRKPWAYGD